MEQWYATAMDGEGRYLWPTTTRVGSVGLRVEWSKVLVARRGREEEDERVDVYGVESVEGEKGRSR